MKCPHCQNEINIGALIGSVKSKRKASASARNGKLGGWPKGRKRGKRPPRDPNQAAHAVIAKLGALTQQADKLRKLPYVVSQASGPRRGDSDALVYAAKIIVDKVNGERGFVVLQALGKSIGEARETAHLHPHCEKKNKVAHYPISPYNAFSSLPAISIASDIFRLPFLGHGVQR